MFLLPDCDWAADFKRTWSENLFLSSIITNGVNIMTQQTEPILQVEGLVTQFRTKQGYVTAVDGVSFTVHKGETLGIVGESGCGKSVTSLSILRLLPGGIGRIAKGKVIFKGEDLTQKTNKELSHIRLSLIHI